MIIIIIINNNKSRNNNNSGKLIRIALNNVLAQKLQTQCSSIKIALKLTGPQRLL